MFKGERIKVLLEEKNVTKKSLADAVNISTLGLDGTIAGSNVRAGNLEKIADFFKLPIDYFFDRDINSSGINIGHQVKGNGNKISGDITLSECRKEIEHLNALLEEKERVITEKERTIQILIQKQK